MTSKAARGRVPPKRRDVIAIIGSAALVWTLAARAQSKGTIARIGLSLLATRQPI